MIAKACRLISLAALAGAGVAAPSFAQEDSAAAEALPACGGAAGVLWIGGEAGSSDAALSDPPLALSLAVEGGTAATFAFRNSAMSQSLRLEALARDNDPQIVLTTDEGSVIAENDDAAESLNSRIETTLGPGTYCLAVTSVRGEDMRVAVQVSRPEQPRLLDEAGAEPNPVADCTPETEALALAEGPLDAALASGTVRVPVDGRATGYYRFTLSAPTPLTLRAAGGGLDPFLKLNDAEGGLTGQNDDADGTDSRLDFPSGLPAGDYCIGVAALSPGEGRITLSAEKLDRDSFLRGAYARGEVVPPLDGSFPVEMMDLPGTKQTVLLHDGGAKWVGFDIARPTVAIIRAYGSIVGADARLALFSQSGRPVGDDDDSGGNLDSQLGPILLEPGRYALAVGDLNRRQPASGPIRPIGVLFDLFERVE